MTSYKYTNLTDLDVCVSLHLKELTSKKGDILDNGGCVQHHVWKKNVPCYLSTFPAIYLSI